MASSTLASTPPVVEQQISGVAGAAGDGLGTRGDRAAAGSGFDGGAAGGDSRWRRRSVWRWQRPEEEGGDEADGGDADRRGGGGGRREEAFAEAAGWRGPGEDGASISGVDRSVAGRIEQRRRGSASSSAGELEVRARLELLRELRAPTPPATGAAAGRRTTSRRRSSLAIAICFLPSLSTLPTFSLTTDKETVL
uniref:Uncharacterized protein n=1 Tax=Leersia perrieri TaxID=77586 RepID=A0A0D9VXF9_9ORYZ